MGMAVMQGGDGGIYVKGELLKLTERERRDTGEVKYYAHVVIDDEPGLVQVNITDLSPRVVGQIAALDRLSPLVMRCRIFAMDGTAYFKALSVEILSPGQESDDDG